MTLEIAEVAALSRSIIQEVEKAVVGKRAALEKIMAAFLSTGGHVLLEDYPGLAKTLIANSFATALGMTFKRIQFTPDLLPGDITGGYIYDRTQNQFVLRKGSIFVWICMPGKCRQRPTASERSFWHSTKSPGSTSCMATISNSISRLSVHRTWSGDNRHCGKLHPGPDRALTRCSVGRLYSKER